MIVSLPVWDVPALRATFYGVDSGIAQQIMVLRRGGGTFEQGDPVAMLAQRSGKARLQIERRVAILRVADHQDQPLGIGGDPVNMIERIPG
ncbi:MAG TPA: hypothetical protein DCL03_13890, partial [Leclercia adecarboxylata]|nr:hypothetical protein [Leclercia adecarboxylata]